MVIGRVVGTVVSTIKHESMRGGKLMIVQPLMADGISADGDPLVAIDGIGSGPGETVMMTSDGRCARDLLKAMATPVRWTIVGIQDP
jgi:ethanolamine utilization protein EutN